MFQTCIVAHLDFSRFLKFSRFLFISIKKIKPSKPYNKLVIDGFEENKTYTVSVVAKPSSKQNKQIEQRVSRLSDFRTFLKDANIPLVSNELTVRLPLDLSRIVLPDRSLRKFNDDFYDEFIEIFDGINEVSHVEPNKILEMPQIEHVYVSLPEQQQKQKQFVLF